MKIEDKTSGVAPGFIGIIINSLTATRLGEHLHFERIGYDGGIRNQYRFGMDSNNNAQIKLALRSLISGLTTAQQREAFADECKNIGVAWMIKNVYKEPKSAFNKFFLRGLVSNPKENYRRTHGFEKADKAWLRSAKLETQLYNMGKASKKTTKNKETFRESLCMLAAKACGVEVPIVKIMLARYNSGEEKICIMTRWNPDLDHKTKCNQVHLKGRYYCAIRSLDDYDMIGSRFQNSVLWRKRINGVFIKKLFSFDFGHGLAGKKKSITNSSGFKTNDIDELLGLVNLWLAVPRSYFTAQTNNGMEILYEAFKYYQERLQVTLIEETTSFDKIVLSFNGAIRYSRVISEANKSSYIDYINEREFHFYSKAIEVMKEYSYNKNQVLRRFIRDYTAGGKKKHSIELQLRNMLSLSVIA
ncbi:MAG: hypothetical protein GY718_05890 [Lentisphaerae bacterium]|nr:hypothetical protein [Lentisphaerota bacterium]